MKKFFGMLKPSSGKKEGGDPDAFDYQTNNIDEKQFEGLSDGNEE
jgi:hypothetical protein